MVGVLHDQLFGMLFVPKVSHAATIAPKYHVASKVSEAAASEETRRTYYCRW